MRADRPRSSTAGMICERGAQGPLGVVLVRDGHSERGHHGIAGELLDRAAVCLDAARDMVEVPVDALANDLGIGAGDEPGRVHEIDEEDGRELAFHTSSVRSGP